MILQRGHVILKMKTTQKDFELFVSECKKWIIFWGISEYRIEFYHEKIDGSRAQTKDYGHTMACDIIFSKELCSTEIDKIKKAAFHEVCEVMLMKIRDMADTDHSFSVVNQEIHSIIRRLENTVFDNSTKCSVLNAKERLKQ